MKNKQLADLKKRFGRPDAEAESPSLVDPEPRREAGARAASEVLARRKAAKAESEREGAKEASRGRLLKTFEVTCGMPWCPECGSQMGRERTYGNGETIIRCVCCNSRMPEWPPTLTTDGASDPATTNP
jgi:hypothetical protein